MKAMGMKPIKLPQPELDGGKPLMQALKDRQSSRKYRNGNISHQTLSNLLWAAFGINRPDSGKRTAPSALNRQEIDVYVAGAQGLEAVRAFVAAVLVYRHGVDSSGSRQS